MSEPRFVPLTGYEEYPPEFMRPRVDAFAALLHRRRTARQFSSRAVPRAIIE